MEDGAKIDVSGGGDLFAYEFIPGTGGSRDVLDRLFGLWRDDADFRAFVADPRLDAAAQVGADAGGGPVKHIGGVELGHHAAGEGEDRQVVQQAAPLADHHQEPAAGVQVLVVGAEMLGQVLDALGQNGDLDFGRAGIAFFGAIRLD